MDNGQDMRRDASDASLEDVDEINPVLWNGNGARGLRLFSTPKQHLLYDASGLHREGPVASSACYSYLSLRQEFGHNHIAQYLLTKGGTVVVRSSKKLSRTT